MFSIIYAESCFLKDHLIPFERYSFRPFSLNSAPDRQWVPAQQAASAAQLLTLKNTEIHATRTETRPAADAAVNDSVLTAQTNLKPSSTISYLVIYKKLLFS